MDQAADFTFEETEKGRAATLTGDWTAVAMGTANERLATALVGASDPTIDLTHVRRCDTAGAFGVLKAAEGASGEAKFVARPQVTRLLELVDHAVKTEPTPVVRRNSIYDLFDRIGRGVVNLGHELYDSMVFNGHLIVAVGHAIARPHKIRWAACFSLSERAGLDALPIVSTTSFFIGAVVGLLGANMLTQFNAAVFSVDLVGIAVFREFNVLITALLLAGRSASAFAAEIGAMKMNQEIDAMKVLGVDPFDALVFPRFWALLTTIPLLVFAATIAGLGGGLLVTWSVLGIGPTFFIHRLLDNVGPTHFWIGMSKAPVLAVVIAAIGCRQGMEVGGDVESLGRHVTSAVVQAIFATIAIDALFALIYMKLNV